MDRFAFLHLPVAMYRAFPCAYHAERIEDEAYIAIVSPLLAEPGIQKLGDFVQHSDITLLMHVRAVSWMTYTFCKTLGWDHVAAARAGILHDYVTYDWHVPDPSHRLHGFRHPGFAVTNSRKITELSALEENMIRRHMWPLTVVPPKYKEAWALTLVDKVLATRETLRKYQKH